MKHIYLAAASAAFTLGISQAQTFRVTFDDNKLEHGSILRGDEFASVGGGVRFDVARSDGKTSAVIFDTSQSNTADPDLQDPVKGGNLVGARLGNVLIIPTDLNDRDSNGLVDSPNDFKGGGSINVRFGANDVSAFGFSLLDAPEKAEDVSLTLFDSFGKQQSFSIAKFIEVSETKNVAFGDGFANRFNLTDASKLGLANVSGVSFKFLASGAIDNIEFSRTPVPEPSSALLGLSALGIFLRRRR